MPELVERGYIYIAQPPLYKIKRGKQETYLKDDPALRDFLLQSAIDGTRLYPDKNKSAPIQEIGLEQLLKQAQKAEDIIARLSKQFAKSILEAFITHPKYDEKLNADLNQIIEDNYTQMLIKD